MVMSKEAEQPDQPPTPDSRRETPTTGFSTNRDLERLFQEAEQTIDKIVHAKRESREDTLAVPLFVPEATVTPITPPVEAEPDEAELLRQELERLKLRYQELETDFQNFRNRVEREAESTSLNTRAELLKDLLQIIDILELASNTFNSEKFSHSVDSYRKGFNLLHRQFLDVFDKIGVIKIPTEAQPFDPHLHQAITAEERSDLEVQTNLKELKAGYVYHGLLLRPAMVKVGVPKAKPSESH